MKKLSLYFFPECPFCQIVLDEIARLGIEEKVLLKNTRTTPQNYDFLVEQTKRSMVPCLFIDDSPMHESRDICRWLKENVEEIKLLNPEQEEL